MATLTKKDLLEAIEDMPMDADIYIASDHPMWTLASYTETNETENTIKICSQKKTTATMRLVSL